MPVFSAEAKTELTERAVELRARQWSFQSIANELGMSRLTAAKWVHEEHARRSEHRADTTEQHLAVYDEVQKAAWDRLKELDSRSLNVAGLLNTIKAAEDSKTRITGAESPRKYQHIEETFEIVFSDDADAISAE